MRLSVRPMVCELTSYLETPAQVLSCEFWEILAASFCHKMQKIEIYYDSYMQWTHWMSDGKYSEGGSRFL